MNGTDRFQSLADVRYERERLKAIRDKHQASLKEYWELVHEKDFRRGLAGDAFGDMLKAWKPMRAVGRLFQSDTGSIGNILGMAMGSRARSLKGKLFAWAFGAIAPILLKKYATPEKMEHMLGEVRRTWDRIRDRATQRNAEM